MRLLVACPECQRQFDASRREIGSRFRCTCGHVVVVQQPEGHNAQAVRCSACGAARAEGSERCAYCGAEFTLHERDLNTICPHCFARVSDGARFCHHCGTGLVADLDAGADTESLCPACQDGHHLASRRLGTEQATVLECGQCAGFWLGHEAFRQLVERAKQQTLPADTILETPRNESAKFALPADPVAADGHQKGSFYRPCVVCNKLTQRRNYGHSSGVIVDICKDHGIWFDADELARILAWLRAGGDRKPVYEDSPAAKRADAMLRRGQMESHRSRGFVDGLLGLLFGMPE